MGKPWTVVDSHQTSEGTLELKKRGERDYLITIGPQILMNSIKTKLMPLDDKTIVYAGHMHPTTIGQEREFNPFREYWS